MEMDKVIAEKQTNSFKLNKMSKGWNWEIKIYEDDTEKLKKKITELNDWAVENWGVIENE